MTRVEAFHVLRLANRRLRGVGDRMLQLFEHAHAHADTTDIKEILEAASLVEFTAGLYLDELHNGIGSLREIAAAEEKAKRS